MTASGALRTRGSWTRRPTVDSLTHLDLQRVIRMTLHAFLDLDYGADGDARLVQLLADGADPNAREGSGAEMPIHVATRRRRAAAIAILLDHGAHIDARSADGKTAFAHAIRRGFVDVVEVLEARGARTAIDDVDRLAVLVVSGRLDEARSLLAAHPGLARTGNPGEDRLLADVAGRDEIAPVALLIEAGADLRATGLDGGTPLHQAAWFGQPDNARVLIDAGAPLDVFDPVHQSSPIGWAVHGARYSGGATDRQDRYLVLVDMLLTAGSSLRDPRTSDGDAYFDRLMKDAGPHIRERLHHGR